MNQPLPRPSLRLEACKKWELTFLQALTEGEVYVQPKEGTKAWTLKLKLADAKLGFCRFPEYPFAGNRSLLFNLKIEEMQDGRVRVRNCSHNQKLADLKRKANELADKIFDPSISKEERMEVVRQKDLVDEEIIKQMNGV